jgi:hypothetical protein
MTPERRIDLARKGATAEHRRWRRRITAVGRGVRLGIDAIPGVVLANVYEHGGDDPRVPIGTVVVEVWGGEWPALLAAIDRAAPAGIFVLPMHRDATRWVRARAWWRWVMAVLQRRWR